MRINTPTFTHFNLQKSFRSVTLGGWTTQPISKGAEEVALLAHRVKGGELSLPSALNRLRSQQDRETLMKLMQSRMISGRAERHTYQQIQKSEPGRFSAVEPHVDYPKVAPKVRGTNEEWLQHVQSLPEGEEKESHLKYDQDLKDIGKFRIAMKHQHTGKVVGWDVEKEPESAIGKLPEVAKSNGIPEPSGISSAKVNIPFVGKKPESVLGQAKRLGLRVPEWHPEVQAQEKRLKEKTILGLLRSIAALENDCVVSKGEWTLNPDAYPVRPVIKPGKYIPRGISILDFLKKRSEHNKAILMARKERENTPPVDTEAELKVARGKVLGTMSRRQQEMGGDVEKSFQDLMEKIHRLQKSPRGQIPSVPLVGVYPRSGGLYTTKVVPMKGGGTEVQKTPLTPEGPVEDKYEKKRRESYEDMERFGESAVQAVKEAPGRVASAGRAVGKEVVQTGRDVGKVADYLMTRLASGHHNISREEAERIGSYRLPQKMRIAPKQKGQPAQQIVKF